MVSNVHVAQTVLEKRHSGISSDSIRNLVCSVGLETARLILLQTTQQGIQMVSYTANIKTIPNRQYVHQNQMYLCFDVLPIPVVFVNVKST